VVSTQSTTRYTVGIFFFFFFFDNKSCDVYILAVHLLCFYMAMPKQNDIELVQMRFLGLY
jgi:hypothetical protein